MHGPCDSMRKKIMAMYMDHAWNLHASCMVHAWKYMVRRRGKLEEKVFVEI